MKLKREKSCDFSMNTGMLQTKTCEVTVKIRREKCTDDIGIQCCETKENS